MNSLTIALLALLALLFVALVVALYAGGRLLLEQYDTATAHDDAEFDAATARDDAEFARVLAPAAHGSTERA